MSNELQTAAIMSAFSALVVIAGYSNKNNIIDERTEKRQEYNLAEINKLAEKEVKKLQNIICNIGQLKLLKS